ncbi:unnamed protein product [Aphanomyces euteiches]|uniref:Peptidase C39-like domain-containing protein n=1 Tax=Aphanomyces euteiches TaxID=100861 RepID=A0A6G0X5E1_9STRA|nr:hypothetical protein Ae201684_008386 [Aphanomyces euteiches]KAH9070644.1 hypothetical protein Ae201684P_002999 [Aphanomyces euteiches]KAH9157076.1 hypothetical protein AeRB84_001050 [Aphanomyces euteiches]
MTLRTVHQTDFTPSNGNALQACFASIFDKNLEDVPNFIADPRGYMAAINAWLEPQDRTFVKLDLTPQGTLPPHANALAVGMPVLLRGKSPRGEHAHVVVATVDSSGRAFVPTIDPHPDNTFLDGVGQWVGVIVVNN